MVHRLDIDGLEVRSEDEIHALIATIPGVSDWYGRNLDALWDTLTGLIIESLDVTITNADALRRAIGQERYDSLILAFRDSAMETCNRGGGPVVTLQIAE